jgi:sugar lactone lactonase YvrE
LIVFIGFSIINKFQPGMHTRLLKPFLPPHLFDWKYPMNSIRKHTAVAVALLSLSTEFFSNALATPATAPRVGQMEIVAELDIAPGNLTATQDGRMFMTIHGQRRAGVGLVEITGRNSWRAFPDASWNAAPGSGPNVFNTPNGIVVDSKNRLWVLDHGLWMPNGQAAQAPRLFAFDLTTRELVFRHDFSAEQIPRGNLPQDLAVDAERGFVYVADGSGRRPAIVTLAIDSKRVTVFEGHPSLAAENVDIVMEGKTLNFRQADGSFRPARFPLNPISLAADGNTLFFGAMNGQSLYSLPTATLRAGDMLAAAAAVTKVSDKPKSNGMSTDAEGNHFITNLESNGVERIAKDGTRTPLISHPGLLFPDSVRFGERSWLYIAATQLNRAPIFSGQPESAQPPYLVARVWTGTEGQPGR